MKKLLITPASLNTLWKRIQINPLVEENEICSILTGMGVMKRL
jgi:hypothetical protein